MNSEVHPAVAALVMIVTVIAIALWAWSSDIAKGFGGPAELNTGPHGHNFVQIQNYLVEHDTEGAYLRTHELGSMGVELFLGGYAFFSNGDILLRRGPDARTFFDNFRASKREANLTPIVPDEPESGLFRCKLESLECVRFGEEGIDFKAAFSVFIDWQTDDVYISDTTRHLLRKYSSTGIELASPASGFQFPNQLMLRDGHLLVADTNNHVIHRLDPGSARFAERIDSKDVVPLDAKTYRQTWPSHFAPVGENWWVNNMQNAMADGGVYVFDRDWQYIQRLELPTDADPISILPVKDVVWVSDWNNDVVRRFTSAGEPLANLDSPGLEAILILSREERFRYTILSYVGFAAVAVMLLGLMVRAFAQSMNKTPVPRSAKADSVNPSVESAPLHLEPDEKTRKRMDRAVRIVGALSLLLVAPLIYLFQLLDKPDMFVQLIIPLAGMFAIVILIAWTNNASWGTAISLDGNTLTLRDHTGRLSSCPIRQVRYDDTAIATPDAVVILGRPKSRVYLLADIKERLLPRLGDAQKVGAIEMLKIQIELRHPQGIVTVLAIIGILVFATVEMIS